MKLTGVSLLLGLLSACTEEPLAPVPRLPRAPQDGPVVITGRVVSSASTIGQVAASVRVIEAKASVGTDETGRYRIVLPASYRGQTVPVNVRAIGFKVQNRTVRLDRDTLTLDVAMAVDAIRFSCEMVVGAGAYGTFVEPGFSKTTRSATKVKRVVRAAK